MMRGALVFAALASVIFFPWPLTVALALISSFVEPLAALAVGIFADTFYYAYAPQTGIVPIFSLLGALTTVIALLVRSRLRASSMRG
ncbi:MAG: hypothetical protein ACYCPH_02720 [Minisyncoccota bacterium]